MSVDVQTRNVTPKPRHGEKYCDFVLRAHSQLSNSIPDPKYRNKAVWDSWELTNGDPEGDRAVEHFSDDSEREYKHVKGVPVFMEHDTERKNPDGTTSNFKYDFKELCKVLDGSNDRCNYDSYSAIVSHHTGPIKGPANEPFVAGYAGPYRLGMVRNAGTNVQKWAIFADEHRDTAHKEMFRSRERRSVEVLRPKSGGPAYFDPIATLGADSPRLPLPLARYQASHSEDVEVVGVYAMSADGSSIERYEFASPSGSNTFVQGGNAPVQKDIYQDPMQMNSSLTPEDLKMIAQAIMQTPQMQWVSEQMQATAGQQDPNQQNPDPLADPQQMGGPPGQQSNQPPAQGSLLPLPGVQAGSNAGGFPSKQMQPQRYSNEDDDEMTQEQYAALQNENADLIEKYQAMEINHQNLIVVNKKLVEEHGQLCSAVAGLEAKAVDAERTVILKDLCDRYSHVLDLDEELGTCLYSHGASMTQEQFTAHCERTEKIAKRNPIATAMVPDGVFPSSAKSNVDPIQAQKLHKAVIDRYSQESDNGIQREFGVIKAEIAKEMGIAV